MTLTEEKIDELRMTAFRTNDPADRQAYFDAVSAWFQHRDTRSLRAARSASIADTAGAKQDDVMDALDIAEQLDEMSDRITRFSNYEGDAVCARAAQLLRTFANHQAARRKVMSDGDLQDIVMGLFGRYTIPADYKLANSVAEFVMSKLPRSAPYGAPFTTDVAHCCGDPETCNDPCEPAIDTAGAKPVAWRWRLTAEINGKQWGPGPWEYTIYPEKFESRSIYEIEPLYTPPAPSVADAAELARKSLFYLEGNLPDGPTDQREFEKHKALLRAMAGEDWIEDRSKEEAAQVGYSVADGGKGEAVADLLTDYIELNMSNYDEDDVSRLNEWAIRAYGVLTGAQAECAPQQTDAEALYEAWQNTLKHVETQPGSPNFDGAEAYEAHLNAECAPREAQPVAWFEAEGSCRGMDIRSINSIIYSTRLHWQVARPQTGNPVWPLYAAPTPERADAAPLAQSAEQDRIDAERYRFLRDKMRFSSPPGDIPTMTLSAPLEAPTHDTHKDWISDRFDASVDRTIDAAMEREND